MAVFQNPITQHNVLTGAAGNAINSVAPSTSGNVLTSNGTDWISSPPGATDLHTAKFIVGNTSNGANYSTITAALAAASSGDTIFIQTGTYTENLTLKAGINLTAFDCDSLTPNVSIVGKCTATFVGTCTITGIRLTTNSDNFIVISGNSATIVNVFNCFLNCSNATGITVSSSSGSSLLNIFYCQGDIGTTGIKLFDLSGSGGINIYFSRVLNSGATLTASTLSAGTLGVFSCDLFIPITTSGTTAGFTINNSSINASNTTAITQGTTNGTGASIISSFIGSGSASAISIGASSILNVYDSTISSTNTNAITGSGTLNYQSLVFSASSFLINTTTQTGGLLKGGQTQAPSAGFVGEAIRSRVAAADKVSTVSSDNVVNMTSITLTPGIWDVSLVMAFNGMTTGLAIRASISTTSATLGSDSGDNRITFPVTSTSNQDANISIPSYRMTVTTNTTVYATGSANYSVGTVFLYGRISATRVG